MNYFSTYKKKDRGFSLIELVVVVGVLAVLSAIAIPSFICFPKRARATAALAALRQIKTECALKKAEAKPETFTSSALDGYTIQTSGFNSCDGSNGVISAVPDNTNELPTFNLAAASESLTYSFRGKTGTNFKECLGMICIDGARLANLPPNESTLFGPDSGLSCRPANSHKLDKIYGSVGWRGTVNQEGDSPEVFIQPVTLSIDNVSWKVDGFKTKIEYVSVLDPEFDEKWNKWTTIVTQSLIDVINDSEGEFSAEMNPDNPPSLIIYSSEGTKIDNVKMSVDMTEDGQGLIPLKNTSRDNKKPWALINFLNFSESERENNGYGDGRTQLSSNPIEDSKVKNVTVCDGRD